MTEESRWKGTWWLPGTTIQDDPEYAVGGTLIAKPDGGLILDLHGVLGPDAHELPRYDIVVGTATGGGSITLFDCHAFDWKGPLAGRGSQRFDVRYALLGHLARSRTESAFRECSAHFTRLKSFAWPSPFPGPDYEAEQISIPFERPDPTRARAPWGTVTLHRWIDSHQVVDEDKLIFERTAAFRLESMEAVPVDAWLSRYITPLQHFLTIATQAANTPTAVTFLIPRDGETLPPREVRLLATVDQPQFQERKRRHKSDLAFSIDDLDDTSGVLSQWLDLYEKLQDAVDLLNAAFPAILPSPVTRFLNICQAAETFHRVTHDGYVVPREVHDERRREILAAVPEKYTAWLEQLLGRSNYKPFAHRIEELCTGADGSVRALVGDDVSRTRFVRSVRDTRNYYTHYNSRLRKKAAKGDQLKSLSLVLTLIVQSHLMQRMGISAHQTAELLKRNNLVRSLSPNAWK